MRQSEGGTARPEVLFVALANGLGGSMRSLATLLDHLEGCDRTVACPAPTGFVDLIEAKSCFERRIVVSSGEQGRLRARVSASVKVAWYAWRHRRKLIAIHANGLTDRNVVALAAALTRTQVIVWAHESRVSTWSERLAPLLRLINPATTVLAVSEYGRQMLSQSGIAPRESIQVVPNPIDHAEVCHGAPSADRTVCTVGYLGAPARYKGFHLLPSVIRQLDGEAVHWVVFSGPRSTMPEVWRELESLPDTSVTLEDKVVDVSAAYARCDIVYCPSLEESFGRVVAEAMANGLAVVASDLPPVAELLGAGAAGILVTPGDVDAAVRAIRCLVQNQDVRTRLGQVGLERSTQYDPSRIAARMASIYGLG